MVNGQCQHQMVNGHGQWSTFIFNLHAGMRTSSLLCQASPMVVQIEPPILLEEVWPGNSPDLCPIYIHCAKPDRGTLGYRPAGPGQTEAGGQTWNPAGLQVKSNWACPKIKPAVLHNLVASWTLEHDKPHL